nr:helix-turn-helix domain-containing protein [Natroniella sulfidigena]
MTVKEVSEILQVHTKTIKRWLRDGKLKGVKMGKMWRVEQKDLKEFIESNKK